MKSDFVRLIDKAILFSFYSIFFLVPLVMYPSTSELFEFNKMWLTYGISLVVLFLWISKIVISQKLIIRRTPLDIPILIFLLSQIISTFISLDPYVSFWGYYSRFNGGLLSIICYIFLYYAFSSNVISENSEDRKPASFSVFIASFIGGIIVALWGIPSHFGYDPTCYVFRGTFDVSCWTDAFQPKIRMFSTLGQPNWLASYLSILILPAFAFLVSKLEKIKQRFYYLLFGIGAVIELSIFDLIYTDSQSGFFAFAVSLVMFLFFYLFTLLKSHEWKFNSLFKENNVRITACLVLMLFITTILTGGPIVQRTTSAISSVTKSITSVFNSKTQNTSNASLLNSPIGQKQVSPIVKEIGGTDSTKIRMMYVWPGAIKIWQHYPLFGSGVETFAYAYYEFRPKGHNMTSEWDFLYNKAHNEYLNYLATTGTFGFLSYMSIIFIFLYSAFKIISKEKKINRNFLLALGFVTSYISILISNFFGFSVVIVNLFLFLIPLFFYDFIRPSVFSTITIDFKQNGKNKGKVEDTIGPGKILLLLILFIFTAYFEFFLINFWRADQMYALGSNLNKVGEYSQAYQSLTDAVNANQAEDLYKNELSVTLATLAVYLNQQKQATQAGLLAQQAKSLSDITIHDHPNNVVYYKTRTRAFHLLSLIDNKNINEAINSLLKANSLAPTDVKILYSLASLYNQTGQNDKAIEILEKTIVLKPNYRDSYYGLALIYAQKSKDFQAIDQVKSLEYKSKAIEKLRFTLDNIESDDKQSKELLKSLQQ